MKFLYVLTIAAFGEKAAALNSLSVYLMSGRDSTEEWVSNRIDFYRLFKCRGIECLFLYGWNREF